ncbi:MAG: Asp-tRNA(Asn)/Glu-tRNA(Gln) amidotransferase subunit GatB [Planctomycetes bacterium]|nr:Asp-tRNA(Asn)/Glu-tRNA(Gln) amidotransferase subunit GatB [Planctomycetota bacterium]
MAEPYKIVIGLEVHVQLLTKTKLFCGCLNKFGLPPNSATCPVCLGLPGALPVMNEHAFRLALRAAIALNCQIASHPGQVPGFTKWDRKNYYYPDLPKNFQISQYDLPFSHDGYLDINIGQASPGRQAGGEQTKRIGIIRAHLEEDAGKNLHDESGKGHDTLVDLNRTGTPLLEIVSHPDMNSPEEAIAYLEEIRLLLREIGVSDCEMQEGSLRCDANVNIHIPKADEPKGYVATPLVEVKNLNSFRGVGRAIAYEAKRHYDEFKADTKGTFRFGYMLKTTAGWDDAKGVTVVQRHKEEAADYRYFPEPDLVPIIVTAELIEAVKAETGELPSVQRNRLQKDYGLTAYDAQVLTAKGRPTVAYFEIVAESICDGKAASNRMSDLIYPALAERKEEITEFPIDAAAFAKFLKKAPTNSQDRRDVFKIMLEKGVSVEEAIGIAGIKELDESALRAAVCQAIAANPKSVADFKSGKTAAANKIKGEVMKANKGVPNDLVQRLLDEELARV